MKFIDDQWSLVFEALTVNKPEKSVELCNEITKEPLNIEFFSHDDVKPKFQI
jgi:hypothetical protein